MCENPGLVVTEQVPHEGGVRFSKLSPEYGILRNWIAAGCSSDPPYAPRLTKLEVTSTNKIVVDPEDRFRIRATAHFADGSALTLGAGDALPALAGARVTAGEVSLPAASITFLALPAAGNGACR